MSQVVREIGDSHAGKARHAGKPIANLAELVLDGTCVYDLDGLR